MKITLAARAPVCSLPTIRDAVTDKGRSSYVGNLGLKIRTSSSEIFSKSAFTHAVSTLRSGRPAINVTRALRQGVVASSSQTSVKIIIQGRNVEVTPAIREHCEAKITKALSHFEGNIKEVDVKLSVRGGDTGPGPRQQRTELTIYTLRHGVVRAEDVEETLYASVDLVCDKVQRKLRKLKEKAVDRGTWPGRGGKAGQTHIYEVLSSQEVVDNFEVERVSQMPKEVVRAKYVNLEPLTVEEAIERLDAVDHDFYMFTEKDSDQVQVVYRRKSEGFGVLIPFDK